MPSAQKKPSSPCTKVCVLDAVTGLCLGCGRTRDEIAAWGGMPEALRLSLMAGLAARMRAAHPAAERAEASEQAPAP